MTKSNDDFMFRMGEVFGNEIAKLVRTVRAYVVTVDEINAERGVASVSLFEGQPISVPLSSIGVAQGMLRITPNVGSIAVIHYPNGNESEPVFLAYEAVDKIEIARGQTSLSWGITPPQRDGDGNEPEDADTADVVNLTIGDVAIDVVESEIKLTVGGSVIRVEDGLIEMNGGSLGDLVVIGKLTARLNKLQSEIDEIQTNIMSHKHAYIDSKGSAATPTPSITTTVTYTKKVLTQVEDEDYNNDKITQ